MNAAFTTLLIPISLLAGALAPPVMAQERAQKVLIDNEKVRVTESIFKPGEFNPMIDRAFRVIRVLRGSTVVERTFADGRKEDLQYKEGDTFSVGPDKVALKNIGNGEIVTLTVTPKSK